MFRKSKKEDIFFQQFIDAATISHEVSKMLLELMENYSDVQTKVQKIEQKEHECDLKVHDVFEQVNKSFITPIDREDIHLIAKELDTITDAIESTAHRFIMFNIKEIREDAKRLALLAVSATQELLNVMHQFKNMKGNSSLRKKIVEVNDIENKGDNLFRTAITKLFVEETDPIEILKWKEIYEYLENILDACEDVANTVEGVVMKHD